VDHGGAQSLLKKHLFQKVILPKSRRTIEINDGFVNSEVNTASFELCGPLTSKISWRAGIAFFVSITSRSPLPIPPDHASAWNVPTSGRFDAWVEECPLQYTSPNAPRKRDVLGTILPSVLSGHWRYAHMNAIRGDGVNPELLGMTKVASEDSVRRALIGMQEEDSCMVTRKTPSSVTIPTPRRCWPQRGVFLG
jgi:hypothetical protein